MIGEILVLSLSLFAFSCAAYVMGRAIGIPYELKTDRLWKVGEEIEEPDEPERESLPEGDAEVIDLRYRGTVRQQP